jgi:hypothetical protein
LRFKTQDFQGLGFHDIKRTFRLCNGLMHNYRSLDPVVEHQTPPFPGFLDGANNVIILGHSMFSLGVRNVNLETQLHQLS